MKTEVPDYWPSLQAYHRVRAPLYGSIIADLQLPPRALILDAACGDAFYSQLLIDALPQARVIAVDQNPTVLPTSSNESIHPCLSNIEQVGLKRNTFDAIWLCRSMHSSIDPQRRLNSLISLLRSGGRLIVIENDLAHCPVLSLPTEFEQSIHAALHEHFKSLCHTGASIERYHAARHLPEWLRRAGLRHISIHTYNVEDVAPMPLEIEEYWQLSLNYQGQQIRPFLSMEDWQTYSRAFDSSSPDYLLNRAGFYCLEPLTVAVGFAP
jgi:SAM-dependent methyltransferase